MSIILSSILVFIVVPFVIEGAIDSFRGKKSRK
jgi:hypothetical protein